MDRTNIQRLPLPLQRFSTADVMKKLALFSVLLVGLLSCLEEPEFPATPEISFNAIEFIENQSASGGPDSLVIRIDFRDGDGDLGLSGDLNTPPFHAANYFLDDNGKLLTLRSRSNPKYSYLPPFEPPFDCMNYTDPAKTLYFRADVLDNTFNIVDTVVVSDETYLGVEDYIYFENNEDHYNIEVDFLEMGVDNTFTEYDWRKEFCNQSFDGRFPPLGDGEQTLDGTLSYSMKSLGFRQFGVKVLKLRITIKDRALHRSNTIETPEFVLDQI